MTFHVQISVRPWLGTMSSDKPHTGDIARALQTHSSEQAEDLVLEQSIEADVPLAFAWTFRTDIATWNDPPATFVLDGPFVEGTSGKTLIPGQEPIVWWIRDVQSGRSFTIEMPLKGATLRFEWHFSAVSARRTTLTQRIILSGSAADQYREQVHTGFGANLAAGMETLAASMDAAERAGRTPPKTND